MNLLRYVGTAIGGVNYTPTNSAIDVVVIEQPDGTLRGSPFHVNFGLRSLVQAKDKKVYISVNGERTEIEMKLGKSGEGFFVKNFAADERPLNPLSPVTSPPDSPRSSSVSLSRTNSVLNSTKRIRRSFHRSKSEIEKIGFDPSCALSDSEVDFVNHRPAKESKSVPSMGYLSDPELTEEHSTTTKRENQKEIVGWKWGELPETRVNSTQSESVLPKSDEINNSSKARSKSFSTVTGSDENGETGNGADQIEEEEESSSEEEWFFDKQRNMEMSLCGGLDGTIEKEIFEKYKIEWETFSTNPTGILNNSKLVIFDGERYFNWNTCAAVSVAKIFFNHRLPRKQIEKLKPSRRDERDSRSWFGIFGSKTPKKNSNLSNKRNNPELTTRNSQTNQNQTDTSGSDQQNNNNGHNYGKTLELSSEQIKKLKLKYGKNEIKYEVFSMLQGTGVIEAMVYLWKHDDKIVVSDIDGTVTKSDVVGHISNVLYIEYTHSGIHNLYDQIQRNGYKFLYLSSRGISQSQMTKSYIHWTKQDGRNLPYGPILLNPSSLISALLREVWTKNPEEFKISCLNGIKSLFPADCKRPFYAGFGNKSNDETAYTQVKIPHKRIFIIDKSGKVKTSDPGLTNFSTSYEKLEQVVDYFFPPSRCRSNSVNSLQHLPSTFWRCDPPEIDFDLELDPETDSGDGIELNPQSNRYNI